MCLEFLRYFISRHETIRCLSKTIEVGVVLRFFLVDLSRRRAILLRGGPRWKCLGGINTYTCSSFPCILELPFVILVVRKSDSATAVLAVVPQVQAIVPLCVTVVPLIWSGSTAHLEW